MKQDLKKISKYFSYLLRHAPESIGLALDDQGWASVAELIEKTTDFELTPELVQIVVETNDKQRFRLSDDGTRIKANLKWHNLIRQAIRGYTNSIWRTKYDQDKKTL